MAFLVLLAMLILVSDLLICNMFVFVGCISPSLFIWLSISDWFCSFIILVRTFSALYFSHSLLKYVICSFSTFLKPKCLLATLVMILWIVFHCLFRLLSWWLF